MCLFIVPTVYFLHSLLAFQHSLLRNSHCASYGTIASQFGNTSSSGKPPSLVDLVSFPTSEGYKNLAEEVGGKCYRTFGTLLLKDESSAIMDGLEITHNSRVEDINRDVFKRWINTETTPVTWDNFLATLRRSRLQRLAALVESGLSQ